MNWVVGQRVCREEAPDQLGTVAEISNTEIKVEWDDGAISFHELNVPVSVRYAKVA